MTGSTVEFFCNASKRVSGLAFIVVKYEKFQFAIDDSERGKRSFWKFKEKHTVAVFCRVAYEGCIVSRSVIFLSASSLRHQVRVVV